MDATRLIDAVLAALGGSGAPTQAQRLLRLHTPLGHEVLLAEQAEVHEGIGPGLADGNTGFALRVTALSTRADLDLHELVGQPTLLQLQDGSALGRWRPWHGHVTRCTLLGSDGGLARYELRIEPWLAFLQWRRDSFVFQRMTVIEIVEAVIARHSGQGTLAPAWRWELADPAVYPQRSLCIQYQESDHAFISRLLAEEGLFCWFEHSGDVTSDTLGQHTLVIADHNGAFKPAKPAVLPFTQSATASFKQDGLQAWSAQRRATVHDVNLSSWDYRSCSQRPVAAAASSGAPVPLQRHDTPGQYAYEDSAQGERLAQRWLQAAQASAAQWQGRGTVRTLQPGQTFDLSGHPAVQPGPFVALQLTHRARNNLAADVKAQLAQRLGVVQWLQPGRGTNASEAPLYELHLQAQAAATPVRAPASARGLHPKPTVHGVQTAIVVGAGGPVHTDRDHRIQVQFHWQRGSQASHGLAATQGDNAPASDASFTWVRVAEALAGANWGSAFLPRVGQEVVVTFLDGDIDRPVVTGVLYNGQGQPDAQGNQLAGGGAQASANAPAWFTGNQHNASLAGFKTQELATSRDGSGGHNQLVFDNTPGQARIELGTTTAQTRLQIGHLLQQRDNRRMQQRGHGVDLMTQAHGALRAGAGLLLSAHGRLPGTSATQQMDSREPQAVLQTAQELAQTLADSAHKHQAKQQAEPAPDKLPEAQAQANLQDSWRSSQGGEGSSEGGTDQIGGGQGKTATFGQPDLTLAGPGGVAWFTPAYTIASAGQHVSITAGQDINHTVQRHHSTAAKDGIVLFTYGKAQNSKKPNTETGIQMHAGTGSVSVQAAKNRSEWVADKKVEVASTTDQVKVAAPKHVLLTAAGSALRITNGAITITTSGPAQFKAAMRVLEGAGSAEARLEMPSPVDVKGCAQKLASACGTGNPFLST